MVGTLNASSPPKKETEKGLLNRTQDKKYSIVYIKWENVPLHQKVIISSSSALNEMGFKDNGSNNGFHIYIHLRVDRQKS